MAERRNFSGLRGALSSGTGERCDDSDLPGLPGFKIGLAVESDLDDLITGRRLYELPCCSPGLAARRRRGWLEELKLGFLKFMAFTWVSRQ